MTRITDGRRVVDVSMSIWDDYDGWSDDVSSRVYDKCCCGQYDPDRNMYIVQDVASAIDLANDWHDNTGSYYPNNPDRAVKTCDKCVDIVDVTNDVIANRMRALRTMLCIHRKDIAAMAGITDRMMANYEKSHTTIDGMTRATSRAIESVYNCRLDHMPALDTSLLVDDIRDGAVYDLAGAVDEIKRRTVAKMVHRQYGSKAFRDAWQSVMSISRNILADNDVVTLASLVRRELDKE